MIKAVIATLAGKPFIILELTGMLLCIVTKERTAGLLTLTVIHIPTDFQRRKENRYE
jgi:ABC-type phosphate transport system permease subunit